LIRSSGATDRRTTPKGEVEQAWLTRDEEQAGLELLEEHHSLPHEAPREEDQHRTGRDARPEQTKGDWNQISTQNTHEHHAGCGLKEWLRHLSLVGLGLRVLGTRGLTSSAG